MTRLDKAGEWEVIRRLCHDLPLPPDVRLGPGDDAAVVASPGSAEDLVLTSDAVRLGVHALPDTPPGALGRKAAGRVLSDFAAMGADPRWALVNLVAPPDAELDDLARVYRGFRDLAEPAGMHLVGGDTGQGDVLELHVFGVGTVPSGQALTRSGGRPGDALFVSGHLGGSLASGHHLTFTPRLAEGRWLREGGWATAMLDLSDGLASDLPHLIECRPLDAEIEIDALPISEAASEGDSPLDAALGDGEDYELLFAVPASRAKKLRTEWRKTFNTPLTRIGRLTEGQGRGWLVDVAGHTSPLPRGGWVHFRKGGV